MKIGDPIIIGERVALVTAVHHEACVDALYVEAVGAGAQTVELRRQTAFTPLPSPSSPPAPAKRRA